MEEFNKVLTCNQGQKSMNILFGTDPDLGSLLENIHTCVTILKIHHQNDK